jgi:hypothetical protein
MSEQLPPSTIVAATAVTTTTDITTSKTVALPALTITVADSDLASPLSGTIADPRLGSVGPDVLHALLMDAPDHVSLDDSYLHSSQQVRTQLQSDCKSSLVSQALLIWLDVERRLAEEFNVCRGVDWFGLLRSAIMVKQWFW